MQFFFPLWTKMESDPSVQFGKVISHPPPEDEVVVTGNLPLSLNVVRNLNEGKSQEFRELSQRPTISMTWWTVWKTSRNFLLWYRPIRNYRPDLDWWTTKQDSIMDFSVSTSESVLELVKSLVFRKKSVLKKNVCENKKSKKIAKKY